MDKKRIVQVIAQAAKLYKANLENRKILFLYGSPGEVRRQLESGTKAITAIGYYEASFQRANFLHLTGVQIIPEKIHSSVHFYEKSVSGRLSEKDFRLPADGTAEQKMDIIIDI